MAKVKECNVMIAGVGGQGVVLMSELLGVAVVRDGFNVRGSEVLGMAVRGGSVSSAIRIGNEVFAPLIPTGKCDILVGMEPAEALRYVSYLSPSALVILNTETVIPFTVTLERSSYPSLAKIAEKLAETSSRLITLDAVQLAKEAGSQLAANIVMLGAVLGSGRLPIQAEIVKKEIEAHFSAKLASVNIRAFDLGYQASSKYLTDRLNEENRSS